MKTTLEPIPVWALCWLINADASGLDESEIEIINNWQKRTGIKSVICPGEDDTPYFSSFPAFGLGSDVIDCECVLEW